MTARRLTLATTITAGLLLAGTLGTLTATAQDRPRHHHDSVAVTGTVTTPTTYTPAELTALPQTTLPDLRNPRRPGNELTGTLLAPLVTTSAPVLPPAKNAQLRVTLTVTGQHHRQLAVALGELNPGNGNHPALLIPAANTRSSNNGVDLVFPGDRDYSRTIRHVTTIDVAVAAPALPTDVPAGALRLVQGRHTVTLSAAALSQLPTQTRSVAFQSGQGPQQHVETGPTLAKVLKAAHIRSNATTTVAAIADDGYVATVTPAEAGPGRRGLLLSTIEDGQPLDQPRLITVGDVSGGRYVSGVLSLDVSPGRRCR